MTPQAICCLSTDSRTSITPIILSTAQREYMSPTSSFRDVNQKLFPNPRQQQLKLRDASGCIARHGARPRSIKPRYIQHNTNSNIQQHYEAPLRDIHQRSIPIGKINHFKMAHKHQHKYSPYKTQSAQTPPSAISSSTNSTSLRGGGFFRAGGYLMFVFSEFRTDGSLINASCCLDFES